MEYHEIREIESLQNRAGITRMAGEVIQIGGAQIGTRSIGDPGILHMSGFCSPLTPGAPNTILNICSATLDQLHSGKGPDSSWAGWEYSKKGLVERASLLLLLAAGVDVGDRRNL